jgi:ACT domain-containing protein
LKVKLDGTGGNYVATIHQRDRGTLRIGARVRVIVSHVYAPRQRTTKVDLDLVGVLPR